MMQSVAHDTRKVEHAAPVRARGPAPPRSRSRTSQPPAVHELDLVAGRRAALAETRCACGGIVGPAGECPACRARREAAEVSTGGDFAADIAAAREAPTGIEQTDDEDPTVLRQAANNGETTCTLPGGTPSTTVSNAACSRTCTVKHEAVHSADISTCCAAAGVAYGNAADDAARQAVRTSFFRWMNANRSWFECRAYATSVSCADTEMTAKKCGTPDMAAADSDCCTELTAYRADKESRCASNCAAAAASLTACPYP